jgi:hypothetical protein
VHGFEIKAGGESLVKYRTAVEFVDITEPQKTALQKYLTGLGGEFDTEFDEDLDE